MRFRTRPSLIARLRNLDDSAAWNEFAASYQPFIRQIGVEAGVPKETLADMAQDVLLTVVRAIPRFTYDPARGRFRSWLARVVRSRCCDLARKRRRDAALKSRIGAEAFSRPAMEAGTGSTETFETLQAVLQALSRSTRPQTWLCFEKHVLEQQLAADVARDLGTTVNAVYLNSMRIMNRVELECRRLLDQGQDHESRPMSVDG